MDAHPAIKEILDLESLYDERIRTHRADAQIRINTAHAKAEDIIRNAERDAEYLRQNRKIRRMEECAQREKRHKEQTLAEISRLREANKKNEDGLVGEIVSRLISP